jgi:tocopherol O-methyltransferase
VNTLAMSDGAAGHARSHYDSLDLWYRFFWGEHLHHGLFRNATASPQEAQLALLDHFVTLIDVPAGCDVLDVGCGYGGTLFYLANRFRCRCKGLTISPAQYAYGQRQVSIRGVDELVKIENCDAEVCDLGTGRYDLILVIEASEHFADREQFFRNAARSLRPGGTLLLACWTVASDKSELRQLADLCACENFQSIETYSRQIVDASLLITHAEELTADVARTWDVVRKRTAALMTISRLFPKEVQNFSMAIDQLRTAFHGGKLQYWVVCAEK